MSTGRAGGEQTVLAPVRVTVRKGVAGGRMTVLPLLLLGFFLITAYYSFRSPLWEAPEEPMHVAVVRDLAAGRIPPLASAQDRSGGEQHQPRLHYLPPSPTSEEHT